MGLAPFEISRVIQAAAVLVKHFPGHATTRSPVLKLLYISDRESIRATGRSITGDFPVAMTHGPILKHTYNLMKGDHSDAKEWGKFFDCPEKKVILIADPGTGQLSTPEVTLLDRVAEEFKHFSWQKLKDYTHEFPEYKKNEPQGNTSNTIPLEDMLDALGVSEKAEQFEKEAEQEASAKRLFSAYMM